MYRMSFLALKKVQMVKLLLVRFPPPNSIVVHPAPTLLIKGRVPKTESLAGGRGTKFSY